MGILYEQIAKAKQRAKGLDLQRYREFARDKPPIELSTPKQLADRREFIHQTLGEGPEADRFYERIINGSELQDVNYLARGARAARSIARILIRDSSGRLRGYGTGFLIAPGVLLTNNHVLPDPSIALRSEAQFGFEIDIEGKPMDGASFPLEPGRLFHTSVALDFTVVAVRPLANDQTALSGYHYLPLVGKLGKIADGEWLTIIQHPNGERKQVCVRDNQLLKRQDDVLWYSTDTLGGSSGSPAFNNDWFVVALHHSGIPEERDGRIQTIFGRDYDPGRDAEQDIKWVANEGIRISRIVDTLQAALPDHPLLQAVYHATPETSRIEADSLAASPPPTNDHGSSRSNSMSDANPGALRRVTVTLGIDSSGAVSILQGGGGFESASLRLEAKKPKSSKPPAIDVPFDATYTDRKGYDDGFLGGKIVVALPKLTLDLEKAAAKLIQPQGKNKYVLHYHNYSVVMHEERRLAMYSAANIDFGGRYDMTRPTDVWRVDPRIPGKAQLTNFYYAGNKFDRGHLTRREDLEFGSTKLQALVSAADTCHWTNCTPQHESFNQNKELWQGIERHLLEDAIKPNSIRAQVFTGPVLDEGDPVWEKFEDIQYPVLFWKVVAAVTDSGKLFATAYILDQTDVIDQFGIEATGAVPFGAFKTFQVSIAEVERLTQLSFTGNDGSGFKSLSEFDPLKTPPRKPRRGSRLRRQESALADAPEGYLLLEGADDIVRD